MKNQIRIVGDVALLEVPRIKTGETFEVKCSLSDLELIKKYRWRMRISYISIGCWLMVNGKASGRSLQRVLTGSPFIKFLNGDKLDFRRENIQPIKKQRRTGKVGMRLRGNKFKLQEDYAIGYIKTQAGELIEFFIDLDDLDLVKKYTWHMINCAEGTRYVATKTRLGRKDSKCLLLHRLIMNAKTGEQIDHKKQPVTNNRKSNLRFCTVSQNMHNCVIGKNNTSGAIGVSQRGKKSWQARIMINRKERSEFFPTFAQAVAQRKQWEETYNPSGLEDK